MRRRMLTAASMLSLVLCTATMMLWARSYWLHDWFQPNSRKALESGITLTVNIIESDNGQLCWSHGRFHWDDAQVTAPGFGSADEFLARMQLPGRIGWHVSPASGIHGRSWIGRLQHDVQSAAKGSITASVRLIIVPYWILFALTAPLPVLWSRRMTRDHRDRTRRRLGHCPACGYNLTGNLSGVCPECGTATDAEREVVR